MRTLSIRACLALGLAAAPSVAQNDLKSVLPENTVLYMASPNLEGWYQGFQTAPLFKIWAEEEVQEFLADALALARKQYAQGMQMAKAMHEQGQLPFDPTKLEAVRIRGVEFAITDLALPGGEAPGRISFVMSLNFGDTAKIVEEAVSVAVAMGVSQAGGQAPPIQKKKVGDYTLNVVEIPSEQAKAMFPTLGLCWGFVGGRMILGSDSGRMAGLVEALAAGTAPERSLANEDTYRRVAQRVSAAGSDLEVFMRPTAFCDTMVGALRFAATMSPEIAEIDPDGIQRAIEAAGLRSMPGFGFASGYNDGKGYFRTFTMCPEEQRKGFTKLAGSGANRDRLAWVPKEVSAFSIANFGELEACYTTIMDALKAYDPEVHKIADAWLREQEEKLQLNLKKDVFGAFGPEFISYSMPVGGLMATPEIVMMMQCKDPDRTLAVLQKLAQLTDGAVSINKAEGEGAPLYSVDLVLDSSGMGVDPSGMINPTFSFKDGFFVFGLSRSDVKGAIKRMSGEGGEDVRANPAYKRLAGMIPENVDSLSFTDVAATVDGLYGMLSGLVGMMPLPPDVPVDLGLLPSVDTITKHLFGSVTWATHSKDGFASDSVGPMGPEIVVAAGAALGVGAGVLAGMTTRRAARVRRIGGEPEPRRAPEPGKDQEEEVAPGMRIIEVKPVPPEQKKR